MSKYEAMRVLLDHAKHSTTLLELNGQAVLVMPNPDTLKELKKHLELKKETN